MTWRVGRVINNNRQSVVIQATGPSQMNNMTYIDVNELPDFIDALQRASDPPMRPDQIVESLNRTKEFVENGLDFSNPSEKQLRRNLLRGLSDAINLIEELT